MFFDVFDRLIISIDSSLRTLTGQVDGTGRSYPVTSRYDEQTLSFSPSQKSMSIEQLRINHTGEVCAQALYHSQMLFCRNQAVNQWLLEAAYEEQDHLLWCQRRLDELGGKPSLLNPIYYFSSYTIGAVLSVLSLELNLGFIRATEDLVCEHLHRQMDILSFDSRSKEVIAQMIVDEGQHSDTACHYGGLSYSPFTCEIMRMTSSAMKVSVAVI